MLACYHIVSKLVVSQFFGNLQIPLSQEFNLYVNILYGNNKFQFVHMHIHICSYSYIYYAISKVNSCILHHYVDVL